MVNIEQNRKLMKDQMESFKKSLNESKADIEKLIGKDFKIIRLYGKNYMLEYNKFGEEYTIKSLMDVEKKLSVILTKLPKELTPTSKTASVYVRYGDVAIGISLKSKVSHNDLETLLGFTIYDRE